jgi:uncharacterized protein YbjT (DUF2867 family)
VGEQTTRICIVGASGKLGQYLVQHALDRGYEVVGVCREQSVPKLDGFNERMTIVPGATDDPEAIKRAVAGCDGVLVVLVPHGVHGYSTGTAQAVLDHAPPSGLRRVAAADPEVVAHMALTRTWVSARLGTGVPTQGRTPEEVEVASTTSASSAAQRAHAPRGAPGKTLRPVDRRRESRQRRRPDDAVVGEA